MLRLFTIILAAFVFGGALAGKDTIAGAPGNGRLSSPLAQGQTPGFDGAVGWLNSAPLTPQDLRGKVVLVDFWTYSCINCIRTLPYIRAWAGKYRDSGLVVVGVHTPEFAFERDTANVKAAIERFQIDFPVALDSDHAIWRAFNNRAWPAYYILDVQGRVRHRQYGEGDYDKTEKVIQTLLAEAKAAPKAGLVNPAAQAEQAAPDLQNIRSGETYVGYAQAERFRSTEGIRRNAAHDYTVGRLGLNDWALTGTWTVKPDRAVLDQAGGGITYRFSARDLHLVLGPGTGGKPVRYQVTIDGRAPGADHGADTDAQGYGLLTQTRLYQLVRQSSHVQERTFEIRFFGPGVEAFAFTFG